MNDLDNEIRNGLSAAEQADRYDPARDETLRSMLAESFRGRMRWMTVIVWIDLLVFTAVDVFAAVKFFRTEDVGDKILYATVFVVCSLIIAIAKLWYWMLMNRNSIKREVKRLELRIAELADALGK